MAKKAKPFSRAKPKPLNRAARDVAEVISRQNWRHSPKGLLGFDSPELRNSFLIRAAECKKTLNIAKRHNAMVLLAVDYASNSIKATPRQKKLLRAGIKELYSRRKRVHPALNTVFTLGVKRFVDKNLEKRKANLFIANFFSNLVLVRSVFAEK